MRLLFNMYILKLQFLIQLRISENEFIYFKETKVDSLNHILPDGGLFYYRIELDFFDILNIFS